MATNYIKDSKGRTVGHIVDSGNEQILRNAKGQTVARYTSSSNATYYGNGGKVGDGNLLQTLVPSLMN